MLMYAILRGMQGLLLNWRLAAQHLVVLTTALSLLGVLALTVWNVRVLADHFLRSAPVSLFLREDLSEEARQALFARVRVHPLVREARLVSPAEGLKELALHLGVDNVLLQELRTRELPYTVDFRVRSQKRSQVRALIASLQDQEGVLEIVFADRLLEQMQGLFSALHGLGLFLLGLGVLAFVLVIMHATQLSIFSREQELEILGLMGAPQGTVHLSFMIESGCLALLSGGMTLGILWVFLLAVRLALQVNEIAQGAGVLLRYFPQGFTLAVLGSVCVLGMLGSVLVTRKMLRGGLGR